VGVDETAFLAATGRDSTEFVTGIVDLIGPPRPGCALPPSKIDYVSPVGSRERLYRQNSMTNTTAQEPPPEEPTLH
jgi:hypothetical protein